MGRAPNTPVSERLPYVESRPSSDQNPDDTEPDLSGEHTFRWNPPRGVTLGDVWRAIEPLLRADRGGDGGN